MFKPRKRRLYTPMTPPDYDEESNKDQEIKNQDNNLKQNKIEEKVDVKNTTTTVKDVSTLSSNNYSNERVENINWKRLKIVFNKTPIRKVYLSLNSIEQSNSMAIVTSERKDKVVDHLWNDDSLNLLDVAKTISSYRVPQASTTISLTSNENRIEKLKKVFADHENNNNIIGEKETSTMASKNKGLATQRFISSYVTSSAIDSPDCERVDDKMVEEKSTFKVKQLIDQSIYDEWLKPSSPTFVRQEIGIFPRVPKLSSGRKMNCKESLNSLLKE